MARRFSVRKPSLLVSALLALTTVHGTAHAAIGDKLDLSGLIKLPGEDWSTGLGRVYIPVNADGPNFL